MGVLRRWSGISLVAATLWGLGSPIAFAFSDTQRHWANTCINQLSNQRLVTGYSDNSFRPQATVTRAEFAVLMLNAFPQIQPTRRARVFHDVPSTHWAYQAIRDAYEREFFSGYADGTFKPSQPIDRAGAIAILANAATLSSSEAPEVTLQRYFEDAQQVPAYAQRAIAAGTIGRIVVNYPNIRQLRPNQPTTRGEVAALLCQALNLPRTVPLEYIAGDRNLFAIPPELGGFYQPAEGLLTFSLNGKVGYMDTKGSIVIPPQFGAALPFSEGLAAVKVGEQWGFIDRKGQFVIPPQFYYVMDGFSDGLARIFTDKQETGFIDKTGKFVIQPQSNSATAFSEGLAGINIDGKWGYMDRTGAIVIQPQFAQAKTFSQGLAPVRIIFSDFTSLWGYIDRTGKVAIKPQFYDAQPFSEGLAAVEIGMSNSGNRWGYVDANGKVIISPQFHPPTDDFRGTIVTPFSGGVAIARRGEQVGFLDRAGKWTVMPQIADTNTVSDGLAWVNVGGTWVKELIACSHNSGCQYATTLKGGKWGYIRVSQ